VHRSVRGWRYYPCNADDAMRVACSQALITNKLIASVCQSALRMRTDPIDASEASCLPDAREHVSSHACALPPEA
jgi:hypothetical protein